MANMREVSDSTFEFGSREYKISLRQCAMEATKLLAAGSAPGTPLSRQICVRTLHTMMYATLYQNPDDDSMKLLRRAHPAFFNALFTFALMPRTDEQYEELAVSLETCHSRPCMECRSIHGAHTRETYDVLLEDNPQGSEFLAFVYALFEGLNMFLTKLHAGTLKSAMNKAEGGRPDKSLDRPLFYLLSDGIQQNVDSCCMWFEKTRHAVVLAFLGTCMENYPSRFYAPVIAHREIVPVLVSCFREYYDAITCSDNSWRDMSHYKIRDHECNVFFLCVIWATTDRHRFYDLAEFMSADPLGMYNALALLVQLYHSPEYNTRVETLVNRSHRSKTEYLLKIVQLAHACVPDEHLPLRVIPLEDLPQFAPHSKLAEKMYMAVQDPNSCRMALCVLIMHQKLRGCLNPECINGEPEPNANPFPRCGGCNVVTYCCRECQRTAWNYPGCPHKHFCRPAKLLAIAWKPFSPDKTTISPTDQELEDALKKDPQAGTLTMEEIAGFIGDSDAVLAVRAEYRSKLGSASIEPEAFAGEQEEGGLRSPLAAGELAPGESSNEAVVSSF